MVVSTAQARGTVRAILGKVVFESNFALSVFEVWVMRDDDPPRCVFLGRALEDGAQVAGDATVVEGFADDGSVEAGHGVQAA